MIYFFASTALDDDPWLRYVKVSRGDSSHIEATANPMSLHVQLGRVYNLQVKHTGCFWLVFTLSLQCQGKTLSLQLASDI